MSQSSCKEKKLKMFSGPMKDEPADGLCALKFRIGGDIFCMKAGMFHCIEARRQLEFSDTRWKNTRVKGAERQAHIDDLKRLIMLLTREHANLEQDLARVKCHLARNKAALKRLQKNNVETNGGKK